MIPLLVRPILIQGDLVLRIDLPGDPRRDAVDPLISDRRRAVGVLATRLVAQLEPAKGPPEPHAVSQERASDGRIHVVEVIDGGGRRQAPILEVLSDVVGLPVAARPAKERVPMEGIAAVLGNHVDADAALLRVGGDGARLVVDLLDHPEIGVRRLPAIVHMNVQTVDLHGIVILRGEPPPEHVRLLNGRRAAEVGFRELHTGNNRARGAVGP